MPKQALPVQVRVDLRVMIMKGYSTLLRYLELELHHWIQFSIMARIPLCVWGGLTPLQWIQSANSKLCQ